VAGGAVEVAGGVVEVAGGVLLRWLEELLRWLEELLMAGGAVEVAGGAVDEAGAVVAGGGWRRLEDLMSNWSVEGCFIGHLGGRGPIPPLLPPAVIGRFWAGPALIG
jgi:hypothetical protein